MRRVSRSWCSGLLVLGALLFGASAPARAQSLERIFTAGNEAYFRGDFARAVAQYESLIDARVHDPDVYFNLATAHARLGHLGHAVLYFERCLWLRAGDDTAAEGLAAARAELGRRRAERDGEALLQARPPLFEALLSPLSADALAWALLLLDLAFFGALLLRPRTRDGLRLGLTIALPLLALLILVSGAGLLIKTQAFAEGEPAIVLREGAELREGPDRTAQVRAHGHEGELARVIRREGSFARVHLSQGARGWINNKDLERIRPN